MFRTRLLPQLIALNFLLASACAPKAPPQAPASGTPLAPSATPSTSSAGSATSGATPTIPAYIESVVAASDRSPEDRILDAQRKPGEVLAFFGIAPGMRVAELAAGGGYTSELLARTVGSTGTFYGQNNKFILERFAEKPWSERLAKPVMKGAIRLDSEFEAPFPPDVKELDAVLMVLFYHDTVWLKTDRAAMNRAIFSALKPGGVYGIVDHSARPGDADTVAQTLHRIEESLVVKEVEAAGFALEGRATFLQNPEDTRDWNDSPMAAGEKRGKSDRFVLKFVKPTQP